MCSPLSEAELQQLEGRKTRKRASVSCAFNDVRDVLEGQREIEDTVENGRDFGSDEDFFVGENNKKRKLVKKKKGRLSKMKSSTDVSLTAPTMAQPALNESENITIKSEHRTQQKSSSLLPTSTILQVANAYDIKIPSIVPNKDNQGTQLLYTQAPMKNTPCLPTPTNHQVVKTLPSQPQNVSRGMVQVPNDMLAKIMDTESKCSQPASLTYTSSSSHQVAKISPSQIKHLLPGQIIQKQHSQQAANISQGRSRGRNVTQAGPSAHARHLAQGAPRPARLPSMVRPSPPSRCSQMRPRIPGYPGVMSQQYTPTVNCAPRPRLSSSRCVQRVLFRPDPQRFAHSSPTESSVPRPNINPGFSSTERILCTTGFQPVQPPVVELDLEISPKYDPTLAPINTSTLSIPDLELPPSISITRHPPAHSTDTGRVSASNLTSLARVLARVGDTVGKKCLVLYEITESQIQGLRDLGLSERRI